MTLISTAEDYTDIADDKKSRAITAEIVTINNGTVIAKAYDSAIASQTAININDGIVNVYSTNSIACNIEVTQTGGWLLTKD